MAVVIKAVWSSVCSRVLRQRRYLQIGHDNAFTLRPLYNPVICYKPHSKNVNSYTSVRDWLEYSVYCVTLTGNKMATQHTNIYIFIYCVLLCCAVLCYIIIYYR